MVFILRKLCGLVSESGKSGEGEEIPTLGALWLNEGKIHSLSNIDFRHLYLTFKTVGVVFYYLGKL